MPKPGSSTPTTGGSRLDIGPFDADDDGSKFSFSGSAKRPRRACNGTTSPADFAWRSPAAFPKPQRKVESSSRNRTSADPLRVAQARQNESSSSNRRKSAKGPAATLLRNGGSGYVPPRERDELEPPHPNRREERPQPQQHQSSPPGQQHRRIRSNKHRGEKEKSKPDNAESTTGRKSQLVDLASSSDEETSVSEEIKHDSNTKSSHNPALEVSSDRRSPTKETKGAAGQENRNRTQKEGMGKSLLDPFFKNREGNVGEASGATASTNTRTIKTGFPDSQGRPTYASRPLNSTPIFSVPSLKETFIARARNTGLFIGSIVTGVRKDSDDTVNAMEEDDPSVDSQSHSNRAAASAATSIAAANRSGVDDGKLSRAQDRSSFTRSVAEKYAGGGILLPTTNLDNQTSRKPKASKEDIDVDESPPSNASPIWSVEGKPRRQLSSTVGRKRPSIVPGKTLQLSREERSLKTERDRDEDRYEAKKPVEAVEPKKRRNDDENEWDAFSNKKKKPAEQIPILATNRSTRSHGKVEDLVTHSTSSGSRRLSERRTSGKTSMPETIDISSDNESAENDDGEQDKFDIQRCSIDKQVYSDCTLTYHAEKNVMVLNHPKSRLGDRGRKEVKFQWTAESVEEAEVFRNDDAAKEILKSSCEEDGDDSFFFKELDSFVVLRVYIEPLVSLKSPKKGARDAGRKNSRLVLEFDDEQRLEDLLCMANDEGISPKPVDPLDAKSSAGALIEDSRKNFKLRNKVTPSKIRRAFRGRKRDEILLVYPFDAHETLIEDAAKDLDELSFRRRRGADDQGFESRLPFAGEEVGGSINVGCTDIVDNSTAKQGRQRSHYVTIRVEDYQRLESEQWLNDSLVDFWMQWISRGHDDVESSDCHFFTSHFYSTLFAKGGKGVETWTAKKNIDIFKKKLIFIPINKTLHWSLCVLVNPGAIHEKDSACMLFFDSLNMHRKPRVQRDVIGWLNSEWLRLGKRSDSENGPFSSTSFQVLCPRVPLQDNGWDCGVFVCRYAYGLYLLSDKLSNDAGLKPNLTGQEYLRLILDGDEFVFDMGDIRRIRTTFQILIEQLSRVYSTWKASGKGAPNASNQKMKESVTAHDNDYMTLSASEPAMLSNLPTNQEPSIVDKHILEISFSSANKNSKLWPKDSHDAEETAAKNTPAPKMVCEKEPQIAQVDKEPRALEQAARHDGTVAKGTSDSVAETNVHETQILEKSQEVGFRRAKSATWWESRGEDVDREEKAIAIPTKDDIAVMDANLAKSASIQETNTEDMTRRSHKYSVGCESTTENYGTMNLGGAKALNAQKKTLESCPRTPADCHAEI